MDNFSKFIDLIGVLGTVGVGLNRTRAGIGFEVDNGSEPVDEKRDGDGVDRLRLGGSNTLRVGSSLTGRGVGMNDGEYFVLGWTNGKLYVID